MNTCHCLCSASHDPTPGPLRGCVQPVQAVITVSTEGSLAYVLGVTAADIPVCLACARAWEASGPRFLGWRGVGDPARARLN